MPLEACARCASQELQPRGDERLCRECGFAGPPRAFKYHSQYRAFRRQVRGPPDEERTAAEVATTSDGGP